MARHINIDVRLWNDDRFKSLTDGGRLLFLFLVTNPRNVGLPGLYSAGRMALTEELGWELPQFDASFDELQSAGMASADWKNRVVWIPNCLKYNPVGAPSIITHWRKVVDEMPQCDLVQTGINGLYLHTKAKGEGFQNTFQECFPTFTPSGTPGGTGSGTPTTTLSGTPGTTPTGTPSASRGATGVPPRDHIHVHIHDHVHPHVHFQKENVPEKSTSDASGDDEKKTTTDLLKEEPQEPTADLFPSQRDLCEALILPPIATEALKAYTPEMQMKAWRMIHNAQKHSGGRSSSNTLAKKSVSFADAMTTWPDAEAILIEYFAVTDPVQIAADVAAKKRLPPGAPPWEVVDHLFKERKKPAHARSQRNPGTSPGGGRLQPPIDVPVLRPKPKS